MCLRGLWHHLVWPSAGLLCCYEVIDLQWCLQSQARGLCFNDGDSMISADCYLARGQRLDVLPKRDVGCSCKSRALPKSSTKVEKSLGGCGLPDLLLTEVHVPCAAAESGAEADCGEAWARLQQSSDGRHALR